jgi:hypothetical protein
MFAENQEIHAGSKQKFWQQHIQDCSHGTLSQKQYCQRHGLALSTFNYWKKRHPTPMNRKPRFYPLATQPLIQKDYQPSSSGLSLHLSQGKFRIDLAESFSESTLKKLIVTLGQL